MGACYIHYTRISSSIYNLFKKINLAYIRRSRSRILVCQVFGTKPEWIMDLIRFVITYAAKSEHLDELSHIIHSF